MTFQADLQLGSTPEVLFRSLCELGFQPFWLDSGEEECLDEESNWAIGVQPHRVVRIDTGQGDPFEGLQELREALGPWCSVANEFPFPIPAAVFTLSYEAGSFSLPCGPATQDPLAFPLFWGAVVAGLILGRRGTDAVTVLALNADTLESLENLVSSSADSREKRDPVETRWIRELIPSRSRQSYENGIENVIEYIRAGDIYQANIARRFSGELLPGSQAHELFLRLREKSSAPFSAFLDLDSHQILSASPECFLRWDGSGNVSSFPIKGTARRHPDPTEDDRIGQALRESVKDNAEHIMIVDLIRNDLGRVCSFGTVGVPQPLMHQKFPNVHHLVSEVAGTLEGSNSEVDLWRATFPGGSITGAPKIRACEIITEVEQEHRGIYCGAIGFLDPRGGGCANIPIRTGVVHRGQLHFHVGGGIVADSTPQREGIETEEKAAGWLKTLGLPLSLG